MESNRFLMVPVDSSAARMPLPGAAMARATCSSVIAAVMLVSPAILGFSACPPIARTPPICQRPRPTKRPQRRPSRGSRPIIRKRPAAGLVAYRLPASPAHVPQLEGAVVTARQGGAAVRREDDRGDPARVPGEGAQLPAGGHVPQLESAVVAARQGRAAVRRER